MSSAVKRTSEDEESTCKKNKVEEEEKLVVFQTDENVSINGLEINLDFFKQIQGINHLSSNETASKLRDRGRRIANLLNTDEGRVEENREYLLSLLLGYTDVDSSKVSSTILQKFTSEFAPPEFSSESLAVNQMRLMKKFVLEKANNEKYFANVREKNLPIIQEPFFCDYGFNIFIGKGCFFNFNCVILDVCPVHIGNHF